MLTKKQILKVSRLEDQTGEPAGFYEPDFDQRKNISRARSIKNREHVIKLKLVYATLPCGDVVIQKGVKNESTRKKVKPFNLKEERIWGIQKLKLQNLEQLNPETIHDLIKFYSPMKDGQFNMGAIGKEAGLDPFLVEVIDLLTNRMYFYITLVCIYDKAVTKLKLKEIKEKEARNSGEGGDIIFN